MPPSEAIRAAIRERAAKLDSFYSRIMSCRVVVEVPHRRHRRGKTYHIRIDLTVPGGEIVVKHEPKRVTLRPARAPEALPAESREPSKHAGHMDVYVAIRDAFDAARRKLQDYARRQRGATKVHALPRRATVTKLFPQEGFGFLKTPDGREVYFHKNSVLEPGFNRIRVGAEVYYAEEQGEKGPQATTVRLASRRAVMEQPA